MNRKFKFTFTRLLMISALLLLPVLAMLPARAESFQITNQCMSADSLVSWPTNGIWTNGLGKLTGKWVDVRNVSQAGFYLKFTSPTTSYAGAWTIKLTRSWADSPPAVTVDTNGVPQLKTFEDPATMPTLTTGVTTGTNDVRTYYTNLNENVLGYCNYIGIYQLTNAAATNIFYTNMEAGLTKKILPTRWP